MANAREFQEQVRHLGESVSELDTMPDGPEKSRVRRILEQLMDVNGQGLERILQIVFESGLSGGELIDRLGKDEVAGGMLLLHSLHPDSLETRVASAVERLRARLRKLACAVELLGINAGAVRVRLTPGGHACGSSTREMRAMVEGAILESAPDLSTLEILGLEEKSSSGFVAIDRLLGHADAAAGSEREASVAGGD